MREADWQKAIVETAILRGWLVYHTHDSRSSERGFPDLVLVRPPRLIFAELKNEKNKLSHDQEMWMAALKVVALSAREQAEAILTEGLPVKPLVEAHIWRPDDWDLVQAVLR